MPFHVEVSSSLRRARAFNLDAERLRRTIVEPWLKNRLIDLGERQWQPRDSRLKILEGPPLDTPDLAFGQGWSNAERSAVNVTRRELGEAAARSAPKAILVDTDLPEQTLAQMTSGLDAREVDWATIRKGLDGHDPRVVAVILLRQR